MVHRHGHRRQSVYSLSQRHVGSRYLYGTETGAAGSAVRTLTTGFAIVTAPAGSTLALVNTRARR
ncbi:MAG: hypothetical protein ACLS4Z_04605 [Christensenellaceae bacterium]